jgi:hypothetical protein
MLNFSPEFKFNSDSTSEKKSGFPNPLDEEDSPEAQIPTFWPSEWFCFEPGCYPFTKRKTTTDPIEVSACTNTHARKRWLARERILYMILGHFSSTSSSSFILTSTSFSGFQLNLGGLLSPLTPLLPFKQDESDSNSGNKSASGIKAASSRCRCIYWWYCSILFFLAVVLHGDWQVLLLPELIVESREIASNVPHEEYQAG